MLHSLSFENRNFCQRHARDEREIQWRKEKEGKDDQLRVEKEERDGNLRLDELKLRNARVSVRISAWKGKRLDESRNQRVRNRMQGNRNSS